MAWEEDLAARLFAVPEIASILANNYARVAWFETPREAGLPCLVLTTVIPGDITSQEGLNALANPGVQIESWSIDADEATDLKRLVKAEMLRIDRVAVSDTVFVPMASLDREFADTDMIGAISGQGGTKAYRWLQEYRFYCQPVT